MLPTVISDKHHLLVQVFNVNMKPKKDIPVEQVLGYAVLPIVNDGRMIKGISLALSCGDWPIPLFALTLTFVDDEYTLNLFIPGYSKKLAADGPSITLSTKLFSTLHTQNKDLDDFFMSSKGEEFEVSNHVRHDLCVVRLAHWHQHSHVVDH